MTSCRCRYARAAAESGCDHRVAAGRVSVKQLLHDAHIPPWLRDRYPLIYVEAELAAVPGIAIDEAFAAVGDDVWQLSVHPDPTQ